MECTGARYTSGTDVNFNQYNDFTYITDGVDNIIRYDGSTTLLSYTSLSTPSAPTSAKTGLGGTTISYYYKVAAVNAIGTSVASAAVTQTVDRQRDLWDSSNYVTLTMPATVSNDRWDIFISEDNTTFYYLDSITQISTTYRDDGTAVVNPVVTAPTTNTTQGPLVEELTNVGSRMIGVRDTNDRYKIWYSSGSPPYGAFASAYDGGFIKFQPGGKLIPKKVVDYRDGKGTPFATIFCDSADGQGGILQMSFDTLTIADVSITVPSIYLLPGSRGTPAPGSVVNVLNDYMFYNSQAFYNLGSRAQFLNLLSTDEASANIRPTVRQIDADGEAMIASTYYDAKVYFSVPYGSSTSNHHTAIYDTERKAWMPKAFTIGFKKFLRYTDTSGNRRLLALRPGDSRLSEISSSIQGDYGVAFSTSLKTGLYPTTKNRFEFQWVNNGFVELSNPQGTINTSLIGVERTRGFTATNSASIVAQLTSTGWDTFAWDSTLWDDTTVVPETFSESSVKRYFQVERELNAVQWQLTTNTLDARYVLRTLQTEGTDTQGGPPRSWQL